MAVCMRKTRLNRWGGETTVAYMMLLALVPLVVAVGIALAFDRWNAGREGKRRSQGPNRRHRLRL
jgi:hypothetical protein